jgi:O-antigen/teichoic acid export membrane protein
LLKKIAKNTIIYGLAPYVASLANLIVLPIITRDLTEIDYGISGTLTAYISALSAFSTLGLSTLLNSSFFHYKFQYKWFWRQIYGFLILWNIVYAFVLGLLLYFIMPNEAVGNRILILILTISPIVLFGPTNLIGTYYFIVTQKSLPIGIRTAIFGLIAVLLNLFFISVLRIGYMGWFYSSFITGLLTNFSYWFVLNKKLGITPIFNFRRKTIGKALKVSLPLIPHQYSFYLLSGSERLIMDQVGIETGKIGQFNIASMFSNYIGNFSQAANNAIGPVLMNYYSENKFRQARNMIISWQFIFFIITFVISLWLKEVFSIFINNPFLSKTYNLGIILIMATNFTPLFVGYFQILIYFNKTRKVWLTTFAAGVICVIINILFLNKYGIIVAAYSAFIAYSLWGVMGYYLHDFIVINKVRNFQILRAVIIYLSSVLVYYLVEIDFFYKAGLTCVLGIFLLIIFFKRNILSHIFFDFQI